MTEELEIKMVPLYYVEEPEGTTLYSWGTITVEKMTKERYEELFGVVSTQEPDVVEYWNAKK